MKWKIKNTEIKVIFTIILIVFAVFLAMPVVQLLFKSFQGEAGVSLENYLDVYQSRGFAKALRNSFCIAVISSLVTTAAAFLLSYTIHYTNAPKALKRFIRGAALIPMLLPTITYGFAIIYSFGKQGLLTRLLGGQPFEIYGFNGLLLGYVIYTLPISFMLIHNTMLYIDKKYMIVSRVMGDGAVRGFLTTVVRPLLGTLAASFVQCFFLSFTDFGIPASVGGEYEVVASVLYNEMLGSVPDFGRGSVVAVTMLIPSVVSTGVLRYLERYNIRYTKITTVELKKSPVRDFSCASFSVLLILGMLSIFAVIFVIPFVSEWPYDLHFTWDNIKNVFSDGGLLAVYENSLLVAFLTAGLGTLAAYGAALVTARSTLGDKGKGMVDAIALVTNTIPGMVIGLAFLFAFSGTDFQNTFFLIIICNIVHFFSTPYLMMKNSLSKMNSSWETTAMLMGDSWIKTIVRVVTPNAVSSILEVFSYYFVNAMVTISAVIFIAGARTMVITTKIKELQHYAKFNEIFVLSLLILFTNLAAKALFGLFTNKKAKKEKKR